jgi:hypothetical protein
MRFRAATAVFASLALIAIPAAATAASSAPQVWVINCSHEGYKPKQILIACGDGTEILKGLTWSSWTKLRATGKGTEYRNTCNPSCAAGHFIPYPIAITLTKPISCHGFRHKVFSHAVLTFGKARPGKRATETDPLTCPF